MKKIISVIIMIMACASMTAQNLGEIRPSVNAQQFITGASTDVGLRSGQVNVNIPLFSLPAKGIDVPVTLAFNPEHVTYESESSNIGLGWSLMAGGVITATIRDNICKIFIQTWFYPD